MKVFLDSSVWFAAAFSPNGGSSEVAHRLAAGQITVIVTKQVIAETVRNLQAKGNPVALGRFFDLYAEVRPTAVEPKQSRIRKAEAVINRKDVPILAGAKTSNCQYLVTLDRRHFFTDEVAQFAKPTEILLPRDLLEKISDQRYQNSR